MNSLSAIEQKEVASALTRAKARHVNRAKNYRIAAESSSFDDERHNLNQIADKYDRLAQTVGRIAELCRAGKICIMEEKV